MEKITLTVKETASMIGVSTATIYTMARGNEIPHVRVRNRILFHKQTIESWLAGDQSDINKQANQA